MCIYSILPTNFQKKRRGGVESTPPRPCGTEKSVVLRGLSLKLNFSLSKVTRAALELQQIKQEIDRRLQVSIYSFSPLLGRSKEYHI